MTTETIDITVQTPRARVMAGDVTMAQLMELSRLYGSACTLQELITGIIREASNV